MITGETVGLTGASERVAVWRTEKNISKSRKLEHIDVAVPWDQPSLGNWVSAIFEVQATQNSILHKLATHVCKLQLKFFSDRPFASTLQSKSNHIVLGAKETKAKITAESLIPRLCNGRPTSDFNKGCIRLRPFRRGITPEGPYTPAMERERANGRCGQRSQGLTDKFLRFIVNERGDPYTLMRKLQERYVS